MSSERLNEFLILQNQDISSLLAQFDNSLVILNFSLMKDGMSNTGYMLTTNSGKYLIKLYSNTTDKIETATYRYLENKINIPRLFYYDGSKQKFPYAFTIIEYLDGVSLTDSVRAKGAFQEDVIYRIGEMCAKIHSKKYDFNAHLDDDLNAIINIPDTCARIRFLLNEKPKAYLKPETIKKLQNYIELKSSLFDRINAESVLCHGDLGYGNIMIVDSKIYFIDFEFAYAGSRYHDIGHFFRRKEDDIQSLINSDIYNNFVDGYNSVSNEPLPSDWLQLARLCDIAPMLCLLNRDNVPNEWVSDIEYDILNTIS